MKRLATLTAAAAFALAVGFTGPANAVDLSEGLVGYWPFDDSTDPTEDASVNNNTGDLLNGAGFQGGGDIAPVFGNVDALEVEAGSNEHVSVGDPAALDLTGDLTLSAWINVDTAPGSGGLAAIVTKWAQSATLDAYGIWVFNDSGTLRLIAAIGVDGSADFGLTGGVISPSTWTHVAMTYDAGSGANKIYVDGVEVGSRTRAGGTDTNNNDLLIGREDSGAPRPFDGLIDEVRIYDRTLPVEEIEILASGKALPDPYADAVASFTLPPSPPNDDCLVAGGDCDTTADDNDQGADAVDAPDNTVHGGGSTGVSTFTSLGFDNTTNVGGILKLNFTDNTCLDGGGDDIQIFEVSHGETYDVDIGLAGGSLTNIGNNVSGDASLESSVAVFNQVELEAESGGAAGTDGPDIDAVECLNTLDFGTAHIVKENTGDTDITIQARGASSNGQQFFSFKITIANNTGGDLGLENILFRDVVPGEFDLVDPPESDNIDCTVTTDNPEGAKKKSLSKLEPEFIDIDPSNLGNGEMCMITVNVKTDTKNFHKGKSPNFTPTECNEETFIFLNEGVQVWRDENTNGVVDTKTDTLLFVDDDVLTLDCTAPTFPS